jgi:glucose-1-phosphate thymidylyltransferase
LTTNKFLLDNGFSHIPKGMKSEASNPVNIDDTASIQDSVIGPYVSIGEKSIIKNSKIANSILGSGCIIENSDIHDSLVGDKAVVRHVSGTLNMGDDSEILS